MSTLNAIPEPPDQEGKKDGDQSKKQEIGNQKKKRPICERCLRPTPRACICHGLPDQPIQLQKSRILVLQHPHEIRHKNRSLPLMELCLEPSAIHTVVARRLGVEGIIDAETRKRLYESPALLLYPSQEPSDQQQVVSLEEGLEMIKRQQQENHSTDNQQSQKITIFVIDATWRYAKEIHKANLKEEQYPSHMIKVSLRPIPSKGESGNENENSAEEKTTAETISTTTTTTPVGFKPRRFDIRTPPSEECLSTAECIAWAVAATEDNPELYASLMKPLDVMVEKWKSFSDSRDSRGNKRSFDRPDRGEKQSSKRRKH
jgi:DTW domain-containing protein YfiP